MLRTSKIKTYAYSVKESHGVHEGERGEGVVREARQIPFPREKKKERKKGRKKKERKKKQK